MSIIEQAAKRLEELRRAGAETDSTLIPAVGPEASPATEASPTPEALMQALHSASPTAEGLAERPSAAKAPSLRKAEPHPQGEPPEGAFQLDLQSLSRRGFVTPDALRTQIADEYRVIKRPIIGNAYGRSGAAAVERGNLVMVTSSLPGEGKTFTAINLAMSIAMEIDTTVLLIDGDVAHPDLPSQLGIRRSPGLLDLITRDDVSFSDALIRTNVENLSVIPAGLQHPRATELLASEQMANFLKELASRYSDRIIIVDSPPLLATTEARVLATHMGQIVMVVAADSTGQHAVKLAMETIESCEVVLMVLNKADKTDVGTYYGYYADDKPG